MACEGLLLRWIGMLHMRRSQEYGASGKRKTDLTLEGDDSLRQCL